MNGLRANIDLFFINYNRKNSKSFIFTLVICLLAAISAALFFFKVLPINIEMLYIYMLAGFAFLMLVVTILLGAVGKDRLKLPTSEHMSALLAEDISKAKQSAQNLFPPTFADRVSKEFIVVNHCEESILGFRPYIKRVGTTYHCSLNKISVFSFGEKKLQITTQITDIITGIDIMQNTKTISYDEIKNCSIIYDNKINQNTVKFATGDMLNKNQRLPKLVSAVKDCKEILRIGTSNDNENKNFDIQVASYQLFYTQDNLYKNIYTINEGKEIEKEILTRIGVLSNSTTNKVVKNDKYNFIDSIDNMKNTAEYLN